jgi:hypothetical protein
LRHSDGERRWSTDLDLSDGFRLPVCTSAFDLRDGVLALIEIDSSPGAPPSIVLVVPGQRRTEVRPELAFEFVSFLRFLRIVDDGSELAVHDYVEAALREAPGRNSVAFSIGATPAEPEVDLALAEHIECLAAGLVHWAFDIDRNRHRNQRRQRAVPVPRQL